MDQRFEQTAFYPADILLPQTAEMKKWPVVACDQFTSQQTTGRRRKQP